ncbi:hypothetical protein QZH41_000041 [Actinostola sp. cb2023]|nr:hypothetical protein QZH41_000041 [Actinostola sp. cb2023]
MTTALKEAYGIQNRSEDLAHKEAAPTRVKRDEDDIKKLVSCFTSGMMVDPFVCEENDALINFGTGVVLPDGAVESLLTCVEKGREQMREFVDKRINSNTVSFWDPVPSLKVKTFSSLTKRIQVKSTNDKMITINADRDLFGRLLIAAKVREIDLKEILRYHQPPAHLHIMTEPCEKQQRVFFQLS